MWDAVVAEASRRGSGDGCYAPRLLSVFGDYDFGIVHVADDLESVFVVGGHEGVDAQETLRGLLPESASPAAQVRSTPSCRSPARRWSPSSR